MKFKSIPTILTILIAVLCCSGCTTFDSPYFKTGEINRRVVSIDSTTIDSTTMHPLQVKQQYEDLLFKDSVAAYAAQHKLKRRFCLSASIAASPSPFFKINVWQKLFSPSDGFWIKTKRTSGWIFGMGASFSIFKGRGVEDYSDIISPKEADRWNDLIVDEYTDMVFFSVGKYWAIKNSTSTYVYGTIDLLGINKYEIHYDPMHILSVDGKYKIAVGDEEIGLGITMGLLVQSLLFDVSLNTYQLGISAGYLF